MDIIVPIGIEHMIIKKYIYEGRSKLLILLQQKNGRHRF